MAGLGSLVKPLARDAYWMAKKHPYVTRASLLTPLMSYMAYKGAYGDAAGKAGDKAGSAFSKHVTGYEELTGDPKAVEARKLADKLDADREEIRASKGESSPEFKDASTKYKQAYGEALTSAKGVRKVWHPGALDKLQDLVPRMADKALTGFIDPMVNWLNANKTTAAYAGAAATLPLGVFALLSWRDRIARERQAEEDSEQALSKQAGYLKTGLKTAGGVLSTAVPAYGSYLYFAPPDWVGGKARVAPALYDRFAGDVVEKGVSGLVKNKSKIIEKALPDIGRDIGRRIGDAVASPKALAVGAALPLAAYIAWKLSDEGGLASKRKAADALRKARLELEERDRVALPKEASWLRTASKVAPVVATPAAILAVGSHAALKGPGDKLSAAAGPMGERFGKNVDTVIKAIDPSLFEQGSRATTEAFLKELDKRKWPVLGAIAGSTALLAGAKYMMERREADADADIERQAAYINKRKRNQEMPHALRQ